MRYLVLASDYDGTLAHHGRVTPEAVAALERLIATGRKLVMVTGRELDELLPLFPEITLFEWVVAENGAVLYRPSTREEKRLAEPPPEAFVHALKERGVGPISVGRVIVATWEPHEAAVLDAIREQALALQVIFNKGAVMVLPAGVTKGTGLAAALAEMGLSPHEAVAVGDAENDHALFALCECAAAVSNSLPAVAERADLVTRGDHGIGVAELIDRMIETDLADLEPRLTRHHLLMGTTADGAEVRLPPYGGGVLIAGPSGSGKSTATTTLLEQLAERKYQFCVIDPEGDYESVEFAVVLGSGQGGPSVEEVLQVLARPDQNAVVNLIGMRLADRPAFFARLLPQLLEMRTRTGRPHWLVVDEAHHLLPSSWQPGGMAVPADLRNTAFVTVHPDQVHPAAMAAVGTVVAVGKSADQTLAEFTAAISIPAPKVSAGYAPEPGEVLVWQRDAGGDPVRMKIHPSRTERRRHTRKYAEGELPPDRSFYFRGPDGKLNLRAQNLMLFLQLADGVDDVTWQFHLSQSDYSRWFRERIKDDDLAAETEAIEQTADLTPAESRDRIRKVVEKRYTLPESAPLPMPGTDAAPRHQ